MERDSTVRRSARKTVKPKRYDGSDDINPKRSKCTDNTESKSKIMPKDKLIVDAIPNSSTASTPKGNKIQKMKTPKSSSKGRFGKPHNKMQDFWKQFSSEWQTDPSLLTLNDMTTEQVLETFESNKSNLDEVFQMVCDKDYVKEYKGINQIMVIDLLPIEIQRSMITKLSDIYGTGHGGAKYVTQLVNAVMPEWILSIFMKRYNMTRGESIASIKEQNNKVKPLDWDD